MTEYQINLIKNKFNIKSSSQKIQVNKIDFLNFLKEHDINFDDIKFIIKNDKKTTFTILFEVSVKLPSKIDKINEDLIDENINTFYDSYKVFIKKFISNYKEPILNKFDLIDLNTKLTKYLIENYFEYNCDKFNINSIEILNELDLLLTPSDEKLFINRLKFINKLKQFYLHKNQHELIKYSKTYELTKIIENNK
jgi:hypothetical protein